MTEVLMPEGSQVPEQIARRQVIVYKPRVDPAVVRLTVEKMKLELFTQRFGKPNVNDIRLTMVDRVYEPYLLFNAGYRIQYLKRRVHTLEVDSSINDVTILGETLRPESEAIPEGSRAVIRLEVEERYSYEDSGFIILDKDGDEVPLEQVPSAPSESHPQQLVKEFGNKVGQLTFSTQVGIAMVKDKIVRRPRDADVIEEELFQIREHALIYSPIYEVTLRNDKTGEEKRVRIDGVTAELIP